MAILRDKLLKLRPFLFHLTSASNLDRILRARALESTASLLRKAARGDLLRARRREHVGIVVGGERVELRDQAPLHPGNMWLGDQWTFEDFVEHLNERVFFWPGDGDGPRDYGVRHYERYAVEKPVILRVPTEALLAQNPQQAPLYCRYNSGSPRCSYGAKSPRTPRTFVRGEDADFGVGGIVEVTFLERVRIPRSVKVGLGPRGPWKTK